MFLKQFTTFIQPSLEETQEGVLEGRIMSQTQVEPFTFILDNLTIGTFILGMPITKTLCETLGTHAHVPRSSLASCMRSLLENVRPKPHVVKTTRSLHVFIL
jgi:hypothetical protein